MKTLEELGYVKDSKGSDDRYLIYRKGPTVLAVNLYDMHVTKMAMILENIAVVNYTYDELKAIVALFEENK